MARANYKQEFRHFITRYDYLNKVYSFEDLLREALEKIDNNNGPDVDRKVTSTLNRRWNECKVFIDEDEIQGIVPVFEIVNHSSKLIKPTHYGSKYNIPKIKKAYLSYRSTILNQVDSFSDREYEAFCCLLCKNLSADKVFLTPPGNEGGIDFVARITFSQNSHYLFGANGPIRIIGQAKMYGRPVEPKEIKEFNGTINDVYHLSPKIMDVLPDWFHEAKGLIVPWFVSHKGFAKGAESRARRFGVVATGTRMAVEQFVLNKKFKEFATCNNINNKVMNKIAGILSNN